MRRTAAATVFVLVLASLHVVALGRAAVERTALPRGEGGAVVLPSSLLKITSLEYDGLVSDFLFLDALVFYGGTLDRHERPRVKDWEWQWLDKTLMAASDLDPYFLDPYFFGNAILTWEGGLIREANSLLDKGSSYRTWDWMLPFFAGFNYFYFLQENEKAAERLMEASRRPGSIPMLASLAAKLAFKEKKTETSIQFLEETLKRTDDEMIQEQLKKRIEALRRIRFLEQAVAAYRQRFRRVPSRLAGLVEKGIIQGIPADPYGGAFYLDQTGTVRSTTEDKLIPHLKQ
jgi:tetratricopeptide (TPR) repeat protein